MLYLGVDLGGTNIKAALVNSEGEILCEANTPTNLPRPAEAVCDDIAALCLQLAEGKDVAGVGVGCPGTVDGGTVLYSNNLDWHDFAMEEYLAQKTGLPVAVGNDANVAALGEALAGCAKGAQSTVVVTLGTGVGAGVVLDGKLLTGYTGAASEAGHMVILDTADAPRCTCGRHGCLEALASATALIRMTKEARLAHPESALNVLAAKPEDVNGRTAFDAAAQGDPAQYRHRRPPGRWTSWKNGSEWFPARSGPYQPGPAEGPVWYSSLKNPFWNQSGGMTAASPQAHTGARCGLAAFLGGGML